MAKIPLIEDLSRGPVPVGSNILVEYDHASQWYNASVTISAGWRKAGRCVSYSACAQPPEVTRTRLRALEIQTGEFEAKDSLRIRDGYTVTLGHKSKEKYRMESARVTDLSIGFLDSDAKRGHSKLESNRIRVVDDWSTYASFNEDKSWMEFMLTRAIPFGPVWQSTSIAGLMRKAQ